MKQFEEKCKAKLKKQVMDYYSSGSDSQSALGRNTESFSHIYGLPRVLVDMSVCDTKTTILGRTVDLPFGIAPTAMQKLIHPEGEILAARESANRNTAYGLSMLSTTSLKQIKEVNPEGLKIMQLYFLSDNDYTHKILKIAEENGFSAVAITVDTQVFGKRREDVRNAFNPKVEYEVFKQLGLEIEFNGNNPNKSFIKSLNRNLTWDSIKWIKEQTTLKVILKGVMSQQDAEIAHNYGVDAIWVSNHGGRQLDSSPAPVFMLPSIKKRLLGLNSKMEIYVDGGITRGSDIFKCLAMGADYVFIGRALLYSLIDGSEGIKRGFDILINELKTTMMLSGTRNIKEIDSSFVQLRSKL